MLDMLQRAAKSSSGVITNGAIVKFSKPDDSAEQQAFSIRLDPGDADTQKSQTNSPQQKPSYAIISHDTINAMTIQEGDPVTMEVLETASVEPPPTLGGIDTLLQDGLRFAKAGLGWGGLRSSLATPGGFYFQQGNPLVPHKVSYPVPGLGELLIYGSHGCGKSALAQTLARLLGRDVDVLARKHVDIRSQIRIHCISTISPIT